MIVYKIFRAGEWQAFETAGRSDGAPVDLSDGFIHLSAKDQLAETAARHFDGEDGLVLLALEADALEPLKWEKSRGGALFPHLYRPLERADILWAKPLPLGASGHEFPDGVL